jgi:hypothetical protein
MCIDINHSWDLHRNSIHGSVLSVTNPGVANATVLKSIPHHLNVERTLTVVTSVISLTTTSSHRSVCCLCCRRDDALEISAQQPHQALP